MSNFLLDRFVRLHSIQLPEVEYQTQNLPNNAKVIYVLPYQTGLAISSVKKAVQELGLPWQENLLSHPELQEEANAPVIFLTSANYVTLESGLLHPQLISDLLKLTESTEPVYFIRVHLQWATNVVEKPSVPASSFKLRQYWASMITFLKYRRYAYVTFYEAAELDRFTSLVLTTDSELYTSEQIEELKYLSQQYDLVEGKVHQISATSREILARYLAFVLLQSYHKTLSRRNPTNHLVSLNQTIDNVVANPLVQESILLKDDRRKAKTEDSAVSVTDSINNKVNQAVAFAKEIASDTRFRYLKFYDFFLKILWSRFYSGIRVRGLGNVLNVLFKNHNTALTYISTHRSHIDYLLLSYILNKYGAVKTPNIAAGINLNFWPVGSIFRKAGAFFIRRSFSNLLYARTFQAYTEELIRQEQDIEFFIEGGRSRSGRLLPPKAGMLKMVVDGFLRHPKINMFFVPIFISYDKVFESATFVNEMQGKKKKKENMWLVLRNLRKVKYQGDVYVNFAQPLFIARYFDQYYPEWKNDIYNAQLQEDKVAEVVELLGKVNMQEINANATVGDKALVSAAIFGTDGKFSRVQLEQDIEFIRQVVKQTLVFNKDYDVVDNSVDKILEKVLRVVKKHLLINNTEEVVFKAKSLPEFNYYRNNVEHVFFAPALAALSLSRKLEQEQLNCFISGFTELFNNLSFTNFTTESLTEQVEYFKSYFNSINANSAQLELIAKQLDSVLVVTNTVLSTIQQALINYQAEGKDLSNLQFSTLTSEIINNLKAQKLQYPDLTDKATVVQFRDAVGSLEVVNSRDLERINKLVSCISHWLPATEQN